MSSSNRPPSVSHSHSSATLTEIPTNHSRRHHDRAMPSLPSAARRPNVFQLVFSHSLLTQEALDYDYNGAGTEDDPFVVEFIPNDSRDPMNFSPLLKWTTTVLVAVATLAVAFASSAYSGGIKEIVETLHHSEEVVILGISLFVVGFAVGPLLWAPLSEMYGRQLMFLLTYAALTAFNAGAAGSQNIQTLIVLRFFAGAFGSSPLTNAGGVIADMFTATQRGLALSVFAVAPFMGPVLGPIVGGFVGESVGWRWVEGVMAIFTGVILILGGLTIPETYAPVLLRKRAAALSKLTGKVYKSRVEIAQGKVKLTRSFKIALSRPWILLFREPIVFLLSLYIAIIYGTLYMTFAAFPIIFQEGRGWSQGVGGLAFLGIAFGMIAAVMYTFPDNNRYRKLETAAKAKGLRGAPPESRLPPAMVGSIFIPFGLFVFAWTTYPRIHWIVSIIFTAPFGFGLVLVFLAIFNFLIDSYTIYAASVLAANSVLRSLFGAVFPLFTTYMYDNLGIHWATTIPAFLSLACVPFPFLFYKYGPTIRRKCKFAREAEDAMDKLKRAEELPEGEEKELRRVETNRSQSVRRARTTVSRKNSFGDGGGMSYAEGEGDLFVVEKEKTRERIPSQIRESSVERERDVEKGVGDNGGAIGSAPASKAEV